MIRSTRRAASGILLALALLAPLPRAGAQEASAPPAAKFTFERPKGPTPAPRVKGPRLAISIREAVSLALARSFDISIEAFNPNLRESDLVQQKSAFDPALVASGMTDRKKEETASTLFAGGGKQTSSDQTLQGGISQKIITGAEYSLLFDWTRRRSNSRFNNVNPNYTTKLTFSLTQPLLKNYGIDVNKADIRIAATQRDQSLQDYRTRVIEVVDNVEQAYWDLVFSVSNLAFRRKSLALAKDLLRRNKIQVEVGTLAPIEILEAQTSVAQREENVIVAEREVKDREDALKRLLNVTDKPATWALRLVPTEKPEFHAVKLNEMGLTLDALRKRSDLERARLEIERRKIEVARERRQLLPQLDLTAEASNRSVQENTGKALRRQFSNKGYELSGGFTFNYPLGNRSAEAALRGARLSRAQAEVSFQQLEQAIMEEVRRTARRVRSDRKRIEATRIARRLAEERLAAQEKKFSVGLSTSRDVLEDQETLANALTNETQALVDYNKSLAALARTTHSTLDRFRITLADPRTRPSSRKP